MTLNFRPKGRMVQLNRSTLEPNFTPSWFCAFGLDNCVLIRPCRRITPKTAHQRLFWVAEYSDFFPSETSQDLQCSRLFILVMDGTWERTWLWFSQHMGIITLCCYCSITIGAKWLFNDAFAHVMQNAWSRDAYINQSEVQSPAICF